MKVIVSGGTGFLGRHLCIHLKNKGFFPVALGRNRSIGQQLQQQGIPFQYSCLSTPDTMKSAFDGAEAVVHAGALSSPWGNKKAFIQTNVIGTQNILDLAIQARCRRFIHISTPSLYFAFKDAFAIKENTPLKQPFASAYTHSKYLAEVCVDKAALETVTLRPRGIFGPGDTALLPRLIRACEKGKLRPISDPIIDITYVENVVDSILLTLQHPASLAGKKYNITNDAPIRLWSFLEHLFKRLHLEYNPRPLAYRQAYALASALETYYRLFKKGQEPPLTRYTVGLLSKSQTLDISAAKRDLGYNPRISIDEGVEHVIQWWRHHAN